MISKEEFIREVGKEISLLNASGQLQKIKDKKQKPIPVYVMVFSIVVCMLLSILYFFLRMLKALRKDCMMTQYILKGFRLC